MADWRPSQLDEIERKWADVRFPSKETITHTQAEKLMLTYLNVREDWLDAFVQATLYREMCDFKFKTSHNLAFLKADAKTDAGRNTAASTEPAVQAAKLALAEAEAAVLRAKLKLESATLAHHASKAVLKGAQEEIWQK